MNNDIEKLRQKIKDEIVAAMFNGFPSAIVDYTAVEKADEKELYKMARSMHIDY